MIRVLIIDDSSIIRRIVAQAVDADPRLVLAGSAPNGEVGLRMIDDARPDVVVLDVAMPGLDGLEVLDIIRQRHGDLPVVIFSTLAERGGRVAFEAIARGVTDHMAKPRGSGAAVQQALGSLLDKLVGVVEARDHLSTVRQRSESPQPLRVRPPRRQRLPELIAIGCSTGGPNALADIIDKLPPDLPVPVVIVQHMPPVLTRFLAKRLNTRTELEVFEAAHGDELNPGTIAIAPGDHHLEVGRGVGGLRAYLNQNEPVNSCRPSVDVLFESAARVCGRSLLAIVLTGMGQDGLRGSRAIRETGGHILVQSAETCVVWGMPRVVQEAGLADEVVPLPDIARRVQDILLGPVR